MPDSIALYVHIPFCRRKCNYCSFVSFPGIESKIPGYLTALERELAQRAHGEAVSSIYFGGGTPSLLTISQINSLLSYIRSLFAVADGAEISMEVNPATVNANYLRSLRESGVNRLSLGIQSFDDAELEMMGRLHTTAEASEAVLLTRQAGFGNINLDLIYGLPGQTLPGWQTTLGKALAFAPEHLSLYGLSLDPESPMAKSIAAGKLPPVDPDLGAAQYELAEEVLARQGYGHYEISNWAKQGFACRHNLVYWHNQPYLGFGVAAHSYLAGHRMANTSDMDTYLSAFNVSGGNQVDMDESINPELELAETMILGLRLGEGININEVKKRHGVDVLGYYSRQISDMCALELLEQSGDSICLTPRGRLLSNEVFWRFLPETDVTISPCESVSC